MLLKHPGYDGVGVGWWGCGWIVYQCVCLWVLAVKDKVVNNVPAGQLTEGFLMTLWGGENGEFYIQETHVRDNKSK